MTNPVEAAIKAANITKRQLANELDCGTTTLWRACNGWKIEADAANQLCRRFPQLDFKALTLAPSYPGTNKPKRKYTKRRASRAA